MGKQYLLFVEGPDDVNVFFHFMRAHNFEICKKDEKEDEKVQIIGKNGVESLIDSLKIILKIQDTERAEDRIGVVVDADADSDEDHKEDLEPNAGLVRRWQRLRDLLIETGYTDVPNQPNQKGTIVGQYQSDKPTVGVWLMPDNQVPGKLENFVHFLLPEDDILWERAFDVVKNIPEEARKFKRKDEIKAQVHTWLAWQEEPGKPIGLAITMKYLKATAPQAADILAWLRLLFS
jgi:hypothetical protein